MEGVEGQRWFVNEGIVCHLRPIEELHLNPENTRQHTDSDIRSILDSLLLYGQQKCIVANRDGMVIAGNGVLLAALLDGWTHIAATTFDKEAKEHEVGYEMADNRTAELSDYDYPRLQERMQWLDSIGYNLDVIGWSPDARAPLLAGEFVPPGVDGTPPYERDRHVVRFDSDQWTIVEHAVGQMREETVTPDMTPGRAVELLCADFIAGRKGHGQEEG